MSIATTVKKVAIEQAYVTVGAADLVAERVRTLDERLAAARAELSPAKVTARVQAVPTEAQQTIDELGTRGEKLVARIRSQKSTKDLLAQAEATVALGKGVVTTVRKAATDAERSAKATLTVSRKEAAKAAEAVADSITVEVDTDKAAEAVTSSAKRTRSAAKRTATTATKGAARTRSTAKAATTSARKTAAKTTTATSKAAEKVGA